MNDRNVRIAILSYLDSLPKGQSVQPPSLARELGLTGEQVNPIITAAVSREEIESLADGSVKIHPRLKGQFTNYTKSDKVVTKVPLVGWNAAQSWEKAFVLICSAIFLFVLLYAAFRTGEIPERQFIIMRTILALAGAGFTIGIPGFIYAEIKIKDSLLLRAIGAVAVFAVIYFFPAAV